MINEKKNILNIVKFHKENCNNENCGVSLNLLLETCKRSGLEFTKKEKELFL